ncbi:protein trunk [Scaptodrosophila lebanonensis]|uniref:Protein trunk n=1 Tax=Drosophila lebanonensis TaxID=7225 RepID=A0A6J2U7P9_DROLE|nr:protein trunk [Scaptodrosophila lebanonensis]
MELRLIYSLIFLFVYKCIVSAKSDSCAKLSQKTLSMILGQAFNPRYMSIFPPSSESSEFSYKRSLNEMPFYADNDIVSLGDFPAWDTNHFAYFEKKGDKLLKRALPTKHGYISTEGGSNAEVFMSRPWECSSRINWIDLGVNYFPRYIRSIECIAKKCWYGHFYCKPKSFTIKVLRKKNGSCIRISNKLILITREELQNDYTEFWIWEEVAVNFCCECVMKY